MLTNRLYLVLIILFFLSHVAAFAEPRQTTDTILMISPDDFQFNAEAAKTNLFENKPETDTGVTQSAMKEFNDMVKTLRAADVEVITTPSRADVKTPDAVFPNNWFSLHKTQDEKNILVLYPMLTINRRAERRPDLLKEKLKSHNFNIDQVVDLTHFEKQNLALEGTGSMVLDRQNQIAFVSLSPRTNKQISMEFCKQLKYRPIFFHSYDQNKHLIYHTNVMMSMGEKFVVVCLESISNKQEKESLVLELKKLKKEIINIDFNQMNNMCGNILELNTKDNNKIIVMSKTAYNRFTNKQKEQLEKFGKIVPVDIPVIENIGGGSARCMIAEIF